MDIIDENKYNEFKNILLGCKNMSDAEYFADLYIKKNPETKKLVMALLHGKKYISGCRDFRFMQKLIEKCNECQTQDEVIDIIKEHFSHKENNSVQYKTLMRIAKTKKLSLDTFITHNTRESNNKLVFSRKDKSNNIIVKYCPHPNCGKPYRGSNDTKYVICGYDNDNRGYDWIGCQKDWCFSCGKMLCKIWEKHQLYVDCNRIHDSECCKKHAIDNKKNYPLDYCTCNNKYVKRDLRL